MKHCCEDKAEALNALRERQGRVLKLVLAVNATMFVVELVAGLRGKSTALLGDSLDMFGDAVVYGVSLYAIQRAPVWRAKASLVKGSVMALFGVAVLVEAVIKALSGVVPHASTMGAIGVLALAANVGCLVLLFRHQEDDINMKSAWICSRNDIIANVTVIGAALVVRVSGSFWPDVVVGVGIAGLFLMSAVGILRESLVQLRSQSIDVEASTP